VIYCNSFVKQKTTVGVLEPQPLIWAAFSPITHSKGLEINILFSLKHTSCQNNILEKLNRCLGVEMRVTLSSESLG